MAEAWTEHLAVLVQLQPGERPPADVLAAHALDALAIGAALVERVAVTRWLTLADALVHGATVEQAGQAMGLDPDEVVMGLRSWADSLLDQQRITPDGHADLLALVEGGLL